MNIVMARQIFSRHESFEQKFKNCFCLFVCKQLQTFAYLGKIIIIATMVIGITISDN